jgi:ABC-type dipeptide/oligopeptide/nickel transport system permease subunit
MDSQIAQTSPEIGNAAESLELPPRRSRLHLPFRALAGGALLGIILLAIILDPVLTTRSATHQDLSNALKSPSLSHLLGTDQLGRDTLTRLLYGARYTVGITIFSTTLGAVVGVMLGMLAGFFRKWVEVVVMRTTDALLAFPSILIAFVVVAVLGPGISSLVYSMSIYAAPIFVRFAYTATLPVVARDFVEASRARGASTTRILLRHILPNILPEIVILWTLRLGVVAVLVSSLSFVGLGVQPPTPEWGAMLGQGTEYLDIAPSLVIAPGLAISLLIISFNLLGDGLRDVLDPKSRR